MQKIMTLTLLTASFSLAACQKSIEVGKPAPPPERLACKQLPDKPELAPLKAITLPDGITKVYSKPETDTRDAAIASYIVMLRGVAFDCRSQVLWNADYWRD